jgi:DNA modification methylase
MTDRFLNGGVILHRGDSRDVIKTIADYSIDSIVTDPPYALVSIVKRFGKSGSAPPLEYEEYAHKGANPYKRASSGFMGKQWDTGETAFDPGFWAECLRVLKPGGHVVVFGGTRTYHRLACAIEDAGFEVRDMLSWLYGTGFAKSHNLKRNPICECDDGEQTAKCDLRSMRNADVSTSFDDVVERREVLQSGLSQQGASQLGAERAESKTGNGEQSSLEGWELYRTRQGLSNGIEARSFESEKERIRSRALVDSGADAWPSIEDRRGSTSHQSQQNGQSSGESADIFKPSGALDGRALSGCGACPRCGKLKKEFEGFGSALKPACEPICFARKPLIGTVAQNVLQHGTGAINVDGCRITTTDGYAENRVMQGGDHFSIGSASLTRGTTFEPNQSGRWPANVLHDGSEEVVAAFPESNDSHVSGSIINARASIGYGGSDAEFRTVCHAGEGSAARFFFSAKANADDRLGSKHPTVKPVDLMQWLCRLVTPKGGTILDPFAGTGTTGEAAFREGFNAVLIESEPEYQADIRRRMALVMSGPDERSRESVKARNLPRDDGPLFAVREDDPPRRETWDEMWARPFDWDKFNGEPPC